MKKVLAVIISATLLLALAGCGNGQAIAKVNSTTINEKQYTDYLDYMMLVYQLNGYELQASDYESLKDSVVNELVNQEIIYQAAKDLDCMPTEKEIDTYFNEKLVEESGSDDPEAVKANMKQRGFDIDFFRIGYKTQLCTENIKKALVPENTMTDEDAQKLYDENPDQYNTRTVSHILIQPESASEEPETDEEGNVVYTDAEWEAALKEAQEIIAQLDEGEDFAKLAEEKSDDTGTAANGGSLGGEPFTKDNQQYVQEFTAGAFELTKVDEYSKEPVKSDYGYHIIKVDDMVDGQVDMEATIAKIKEDNLETERQTAYDEHIADFRASSTIDYFAIEKDKEVPTEDDGTDDAATDDTTDTPTDDTPTDDGTADDGADADANADAGADSDSDTNKEE